MTKIFKFARLPNNRDFAESNSMFFSVQFYWVSASDIGRRKVDFAWANNEKVNSALWAAEQPKSPYSSGSSRGNLCVDLNIDKGKLEVSGCLTSSYVVCELPFDAIECF
jgi:Lectin C-type domain